MMTPRQKHASFLISYCMAAVHGLKNEEKPKSRLWTKLDNLEDHLGRVLDEYRIEHFDKADLDKASRLFDTLDALIAEMYPKNGGTHDTAGDVNAMQRSDSEGGPDNADL